MRLGRHKEAPQRFAWSRRSLGLLVGLLLVVVYLLPRVLQLDRMLNTDEVDWLGASANAYIGLAQGNLAATFQLPHPGVTTLWAGVVAFMVAVPDLPSIHPQPLAGIHGVHRDLRAIGVDPLDLLVLARLVKLGFEAVLFIVAGWLLLRLFAPPVAVLTLFLVALDPFVIGHDRFLHIDGLTAMASFAAILAIASAATTAAGDRASRWLWALAGTLSALAWLTRFTVGVLAVIALVVIVVPPVVALLRRRSTLGQSLQTALVPLGVYLLSAGLISVVLWPAGLVEPRLVFDQMRAYVTNAVVVGHELPIFFDGAVVYGDPGARFYPEAILWRMTPVAVIGIVAFVLGVAFRRRVVLPRRAVLPAILAVSFAVLYIALMDTGAKKFDRYVLPAFPVLDLLAALGWVGLAQLVWSGRHRWRQAAAIAGAAVVVVAQVGAAWSDRPYAYDYYNPLLGGLDAAQDNVLIGWGEGLDQAADVILDRPDGATASVRTSANDVTLLYFLPESVTVAGDGGFPLGPRGIVVWATADYYVAYTLQWQRELDAVVLPYLATQPPLETVTIDGVPFAHVYDFRTIPPSPELLGQLPCRWALGDDTTLLTYRDRSVKLLPDDPNRRELSLYFQSALTRPLDVEVRLIPRHDELDPIVATAVLPAVTGNPGVIRTVDLDLTLPRGTTTDHYQVEVRATDPATGRGLPARLVSDPDVEGPTAVANQCEGAGAVN